MNAGTAYRPWTRRILAGLLIGMVAGPLRGDPQAAVATQPTNARAGDRLSVSRRREILREALNAFDDAVGVARSNPAQAAGLYRQCVGALEALRSHGVRNAALFYDLGNAYFRLGKIGRAIANYRRAQRLAPTDPEINANLRYARNRVEPYIKPGGARQLLRRLLFWNRYTSVRQRFVLAAVAWLLGWGLLAVRLRRRGTAILVAGVVLLGLGGANVVSVGWQLHEERQHPEAVVIDGAYVLRLGRGEGYDAAITRPLGPGVEVRILTQRGGWSEIELRDGTSGWLPDRALLRITGD